MKLKYICSLLFFLNVAQAAELRGNLTGIQGASITVSCDSAPIINVNISARGSFYAPDLPPNQACNFTVKSGEAASIPISFNSSRSITIFKGNLTLFGNRILVIRQ